MRDLGKKVVNCVVLWCIPLEHLRIACPFVGFIRYIGELQSYRLGRPVMTRVMSRHVMAPIFSCKEGFLRFTCRLNPPELSHYRYGERMWRKYYASQPRNDLAYLLVQLIREPY